MPGLKIVDLLRAAGRALIYTTSATLDPLRAASRALICPTQIQHGTISTTCRPNQPPAILPTVAATLPKNETAGEPNVIINMHDDWYYGRLILLGRLLTLLKAFRDPRKISGKHRTCPEKAGAPRATRNTAPPTNEMPFEPVNLGRKSSNSTDGDGPVFDSIQTLKYAGDRNIFNDAGGTILTAGNHNGNMSFKSPDSRGNKIPWDSRSTPIINSMMTKRHVAHLCVENHLEEHSARSFKARVSTASRNTINVTTNLPSTFARMGSHAISTFNDSLIAVRTDIACKQRGTTSAYTCANGRLTMAICMINGRKVALLCVYGITSSCGAKSTTAYIDTEEMTWTKKSIASDQSKRLLDRKTAKEQLNKDILTCINKARSIDAAIILYTDANCTNNANDRSSTCDMVATEATGDSNTILTILEDLGLRDVWKELHDTETEKGYTYTSTGKEGQSHHRLDRFYVCERLIKYCGGFEYIQMAVTTEVNSLSDKHHLLAIRLPSSFVRTKQKKRNEPAEPRNQKFYLKGDTEIESYQQAMHDDMILRKSIEHAQKCCSVRDSNGKHIINFGTCAKAMSNLEIDKEASLNLTKAHVEKAFVKIQQREECTRATNDDITKAKRNLLTVIKRKNNHWCITADRKRWLDGGDALAKTLPVRSRIHENKILNSRPAAKFRDDHASVPCKDEMLLTRSIAAWDKNSATPINTSNYTNHHGICAIESAKDQLCRFCSIPVTSNPAATVTAWNKWVTAPGGLPQLRSTLIEMERVRKSKQHLKRAGTTETTTAQMARMYEKPRGETLQGLLVENSDGTTAWISADDDLRKVIEEQVKYTSRSRKRGGSGQSLIVSCWMDVLVTEQLLWNDTTIENLIEDYKDVAKLWADKKASLLLLQEGMKSWTNAYKKTHDQSTKSTTTSTTFANTLESLPTLKTDCAIAGFHCQSTETDEEWLLANIEELALTIMFIDNNIKFLHNTLSKQSPRSASTTAKWRKLERGPQTIGDIARTAKKMNFGKSHRGISPEHAFHSETAQQALLLLSDYYYSADLPDEIKTGSVTSLYKDERRFRPITSLGLCFQICESYLIDIEMELVIDNGSKRQFGGVMGRGANEPLLEMQLLVADAVHNNKALLAHFSDKTSAFDSIAPSLFPLIYKRWHCPSNVSARMTGVMTKHRRVIKTSFRTNTSDTSVAIEGSVPQGGILSAIRFIGAADILITAEQDAACYPYMLTSPKDDSEHKYISRNFMDDGASSSTAPTLTDRDARSPDSGLQAGAIAGSFLSIANNPSKTAILSTDPTVLKGGIKLIQLSGHRLTAETVHVSDPTKIHRDLGWMQNFQATHERFAREKPTHDRNAKTIKAVRSRTTMRNAPPNIYKDAITLICLGNIINSIAVELPMHRSTLNRIDKPLMKTALALSEIEPGPDAEWLTLHATTPRYLGGAGYPGAGVLGCRTAGTTVSSIFHSNNHLLQTACLVGFAEKQLGPATNIANHLRNACIEVHGGDPVPSGDTQSDIMARTGVSERYLCAAADLSIRFPNMLFRVCRQTEVQTLATDGSPEATEMRIQAKDSTATISVEDTILGGSKLVKSQWISTTRNLESALRLWANNTEKHANEVTMAVLDERKCTVAHDLSTESGRLAAGLHKDSAADNLAASYNEVLLQETDTLMSTNSDNAILDWFKFKSIVQTTGRDDLKPKADTPLVYQLSQTDAISLADRLEAKGKAALLADSTTTERDTASITHLTLISDASVRKASESKVTYKSADRAYQHWVAQQEELKLLERETSEERYNLHLSSLKRNLSANQPKSTLMIVYVYHDFDAGADSDTDDPVFESGWFLSALRISNANGSIEIMDLTTADTATADDSEYKLPFSGTEKCTGDMFAQKLDAPFELTHPWAPQKSCNIIWAPATAEPQLWQTTNTKDQNILLKKRRCKMLPRPASAHDLIAINFLEMHSAYTDGHCASWLDFHRRPGVQTLLQTKHCSLMQTKMAIDDNSPNVHIADGVLVERLIDCIKYGQIPSVSYQAHTLAKEWDAWTRQDPYVRFNMDTKRQHGTDSSICKCFTHTIHNAAEHSCTARSHSATTKPPPRRSAGKGKSPGLTLPGAAATTADQPAVPVLVPEECFTCTCGARFESDTALNIHRFTRSENDTQFHQRCATELPTAGGGYVIFDTKKMKAVGAGLVDCTPRGCDVADSTQAETTTAIYGLQHLLRLHCTDMHITSYCDNAALELRTITIQNEYLSKRKKVRMNHLDTSEAYSGYHAAVSRKAASFHHYWRGAEHNLATNADRQLADYGNMFSDHFANIAAAAGSKLDKTIIEGPPLPKLKQSPIMFKLNGSESNMPIAKLMETTFHCQSASVLSKAPAENDERTHPQRHQHHAHAINTRLMLIH